MVRRLQASIFFYPVMFGALVMLSWPVTYEKDGVKGDLIDVAVVINWQNNIPVAIRLPSCGVFTPDGKARKRENHDAPFGLPSSPRALDIHEGHHNLMVCGDCARKFRLFAQRYEMEFAATGRTTGWPV